MPELLQHKHCKNCGRAISTDQDLCDDPACAAHWQALTKKRARTQLLFYVASAVLLLTLLYGFLQPIL